MSLYLSKTIRQVLLLWAIMPMKQLWIAPWTHQPQTVCRTQILLRRGDYVSE